MSHIVLMFMAMPFLGVRLGMPMITGGGNTTPPTPPTVFLAMDMSDFRNTYILGL